MQVHSIANANVFQLSSMARAEAASRKLALPVKSSLVMYSRFKHVHGTPSLEKGTGLPLSSLRAMDSLIERLIAVRGRNTYWGSVEGMNGDDIGFAVERLQIELHKKIASPELLLTAGRALNDMGLNFNFVA